MKNGKSRNTSRDEWRKKISRPTVAQKMHSIQHVHIREKLFSVKDNVDESGYSQMIGTNECIDSVDNFSHWLMDQIVRREFRFH